ncbi:MAG: hypothetical protein N0E58_07150, partial [Candidatus Thiodiazotropha endolucinida]|nr:hypothetical protein [Candidatus Thiodiazotropha taylori]MCW4236027.1 hypothetical protein [Candidatus Thiodiazotropha endolucinida]
MDGDGVETVGLSSNIHFDHAGDSFREATGFAASDDGLLVWDRNGDGSINNGRELFGNATTLSDGTQAENGFQAMTELDSNSDGIVDINDELFGELRVFRDLDQDGATDEGELFALNEAGVESISLDYTNESFIDEFGNEHRQVGSYTHTNGETRTMTDVWFDRNLSDTIEETIPVTADIAALPDARGFGLNHSLHQAMARDGSGELQQLVTAFVNAGSREERQALMEPIIYAWTNQEGDYRPHFQSPIDARKIGALEAFYGYPVDDPRGSGQQYARLYEGIFSQLVDTVFYQLTARTHLSPFFSKITWSEDAATGNWLGDFSNVVGDLFSYAEANAASAQDIMVDFAQAIRGVNVYEPVNVDRLRNAVDQYIQTHDMTVYSDQTVGLVVAATMNATHEGDSINGTIGDNHLFGLGGDDMLTAQAGNDVLDGGAGNDQLMGGAGDDQYRFGVGYGHDRIRNQDSGEGRFDVVRMLGGLTANDITVSRQSDDLVIAINAADDVLRVESHFDQEGASQSYIDAILFDDGSQLDVGPAQFDQINVASQVITEGDDQLHGTSLGESINGLSGDDSIYGKDGQDWIYGDAGNDQIFGDEGSDVVKGGSGNDLLDGGQGDDYLNGESGHDELKGGFGNDVLRGSLGDDILIGGQGSDRYFYGLGDGLDLIDNQGSIDDIDNIILKDGILSENVIIRRSDNDLMIILDEGLDEIRVQNYYRNSTSRIDNLIFTDPSSTDPSWDSAALESLANQPTENNDELHGDDNSNSLDGLAGDDLLVGHRGDDTLQGSGGDDTLQGDDGDDQLFGGEGSDNLQGGRGNDRLQGGSGDDELSGGSGSDTYVISADGSHDVINDYDNRNSDIDRILFDTGITPSNVNYRRTTTDLVIDITIDGIQTSVTIDNGFTNSRNLIDSLEFEDGTVISIDEVMTQAANWTGTDEAETANGYEGDDMLDGAGGNDRLYGRAGDDTVSGGVGDDYVYGEAGNDTLTGGDGRDRLYGGAGTDSLSGEAGNDYLYGGDGNDTLRGGTGT